VRAVALATVLGVLLAIPGPAGAQDEAPASTRGAEKSFTWGLGWDGWGGLQYEVRQRVSVGGPDQVIPYRLIDERVGLKGRIGGKLAIDGGAFFTTGDLSDLDNGVEVRRARLYTTGEIYLVVPISYKLEISYVGDVGIVVEENYLAVRNVPYIQSVTVGNTQTPFALEAVIGGRDVTFMEIAAPTQAFAPGVKPGILFGGPVLDNRMTWGFGWFSGTGSTELGSFSGKAISIGRVTGLPVDRGEGASRQLVHLGMSANISLGSADPIRYQARPESHLAPFTVLARPLQICLDEGDLARLEAWAFVTEPCPSGRRSAPAGAPWP
jgi:hypothetical protein